MAGHESDEEGLGGGPTQHATETEESCRGVERWQAEQPEKLSGGYRGDRRGLDQFGRDEDASLVWGGGRPRCRRVGRTGWGSTRLRSMRRQQSHSRGAWSWRSRGNPRPVIWSPNWEIVRPVQNRRKRRFCDTDTTSPAATDLFTG